MLSMCIPIPSRLPPALIPSSETLISPSSNDSPLFPPPSGPDSPVPAPDRISLSTMNEEEQSELNQEYDEMVLEDQCSYGHRSVLPIVELNQESDECYVEKVLEEQVSNVGGEKVLEGHEFLRAGESFLDEISHEAADEATNCLGQVGSEPCVSGYQHVGVKDGDASHSFSPFHARFVRKDSKPVASQTRHDSFSSSDDYSGNSEDGGFRMHALSSRPPPPPPLPVGAGLGNMGNTCFLNAVMQCFTHTVPLVLGLKLYNCGLPSHHNDGEFCVLSAVCDHVSYALAAPGEVIFPENLVNNLSNISSFFQRFQQEDAHEYLQCLLDKTDTCLSKCKVAGNGFSSQGDSLVKQVFGGRLVSQLHCCKCGSRSDTYEPLVDLSLEIEDAVDLNGALKSFTKMEQNEHEVKFTCEKCKEQVPLKKQLLIDQAPCVATLHLKRFKGDGYFVEKIDKALEYPLELDLKPYTVYAEDESVDLKYELYGVIVHMGFSSTSGHYLCYIRSSPDRWFKIDDSKVAEVKEEVALSQQGYILFYAKKGTPWPYSLIKSSRDNGFLSTSPKSVLDALKYTQHSNPQKACFYNQNEVEGITIMEMGASTDLELPFPQAETGSNANEVATNKLSTIPENEVTNEELFAAGNTQHSNLQKACLYNQSAAEGTSVMEMEASTEPELPFQPVFDEDASNEPSDMLKNVVSSQELIAAGIPNSSLYSGVTKNEAKIINRLDALNPIPTADGMLAQKNKSSIPTMVVSNEPKVNALNGNAILSPPLKSKSPSPGIHPEAEYRLHPAAVDPRSAKKVKVEKSASPVKPIKLVTASDYRKRQEAIKALRGLPSSRRGMLMNAICGSGNEGSVSKKRWPR